MTSPEPSALPPWPPPGVARAFALGPSLLRSFVFLSAATALWMAVASLINQVRLGPAASAGLMLGLPLAAVVAVAALAAIYLALRTAADRRWGYGLALFVIAGYLFCAWWCGDSSAGRPVASLGATLLLACNGLLLAWLLPRAGTPLLRSLRISLLTAVLGSFVAVLGAQALAESYRLQAAQQGRLIAHQLVYLTYDGMAEANAWLRRLADRWALLSAPPSQALMEQELRSYLRDMPVFRELAVVDSDGDIFALNANSNPLQQPLLATQLLESIELETARATAQPYRSSALPTSPGRIEEQVFVPVPNSGSPPIVIVASIRLHQLFDRVALRAPLGFDFRVRYHDTIAYQTRVEWPRYAETRGTLPLPLAQGAQWHLDYVFRPMAVGPLAPWFPEIILAAGFVFTFLLIISQQFALLARGRARQLQHSALHDALTGLPNRRLLEQSLGDICEQLRSRPGTVAIIFVDLDGVKLINDSMGHTVGDRLLIEVARRIVQLTGERGFAARVGGDEFVVLLRDTPAAAIEALTEQIIANLAKPYFITTTELRVTATAGITLHEGEVKDPMQLVREADLAMVRAKQEGRNTWRKYTVDLSVRVAERLAVRNELQQALDEERFELHFLPVIDGQNGRIVGLEALLRWHKDHEGYLPPGRFLPLAEETGQIVPLSDWVLRKACEHAQALRQAGFDEIPIIINTSPLVFQRADFVDNLRAALQAAELPAASLEVEITEGVLLEDAERATRTLSELRELGVKTSIDDFGTGYSSLNYLKNLPIDKIKIDRSFVVDVISDPNDAAIVQSIIALAHHLELRVVAEGIETEAQFSFLKRHQCDEYQGFLFFHPTPFSTMLQQLRERGTRLLLPDAERPAEMQRTLLIVDDEPNILRALVRSLRRESYRILVANTPTEAFEALARNHVQVIISDQRMPELNGIEFLRQVKDLYPDTVRLILSGYTDLRSITDAINRGAIYKFLTKPWDDEDLRGEIAEAFQHYAQSHPQSEPS